MYYRKSPPRFTFLEQWGKTNLIAFSTLKGNNTAFSSLFYPLYPDTDSFNLIRQNRGLIYTVAMRGVWWKCTRINIESVGSLSLFTRQKPYWGMSLHLWVIGCISSEFIVTVPPSATPRINTSLFVKINYINSLQNSIKAHTGRRAVNIHHFLTVLRHLSATKPLAVTP